MIYPLERGRLRLWLRSGHYAGHVAGEMASHRQCRYPYRFPGQGADILRVVNEVDAASFVTIQEARQVVQGYSRPVHSH